MENAPVPNKQQHLYKVHKGENSSRRDEDEPLQISCHSSLFCRLFGGFYDEEIFRSHLDFSRFLSSATTPWERRPSSDATSTATLRYHPSTSCRLLTLYPDRWVSFAHPFFCNPTAQLQAHHRRRYDKASSSSSSSSSSTPTHVLVS